MAAATASAWVASRASGDPGIAKLVAIADAQFAEWATPTPARAKLMDTLEVMEAAARSGKRSAFAGCDARTRAAWEAVVRPRTRPKTGSADLVQTYVEPALGSADGYLAYQALSLCSAASESSRHRASLIDSSAIRRGPRSATRAAWIAASGEIAFDDRALSLASLLGAFGAESPATIAGVIDTITDRGGEVEISFKPQLAKVDDCLSSRDTAQIERIDDSGHVYYRRVCVTWGKRTIDNAPEPVLAGKVMAHGLARGMYLTALDDGTPLVATSGPSSTAPVWLLGATL